MFLCDQYAILVNESIQRAEDNNQNIPLKLKKKKKNHIHYLECFRNSAWPVCCYELLYASL